MSKYLIENIEVLEADEEVLTTLTKDGKRRWLYPIPSFGKYHTQRKIVGWALIAFFVLLPFIKINGYPAILINLVKREFAFFGLVLYPTDSFLLLLFMVGVILSIVLGTALWGRVWCGWACPQTVYLEFLFRPIERLIEGSPQKQQRRDAGPGGFDRKWRKALKFVIFLLLSFFLANVFLSYFVGWDQLALWMQSSPRDHWGAFVLMAGVTGLMLFDFGYFREQMCTITCPYARMQAVLLDPDSTIVSYDPTRGEPRGKRSRKILVAEEAGTVDAKGDCIDCEACVRTCPTGIDIRNGLQMECISCTQCVDACDSIMDKIGKPRGLVRYTSENELAGKKAHAFRPRTLIYLGLIIGVFSFFGISVTTRGNYDINLGRIKGVAYQELNETTVSNRIRFRVRNQKGNPVSFTIEATSPKGTTITIAGSPETTLEPGEMKRVETFVLIPKEAFVKDEVEGKFLLKFSDGTTAEETYMLLGPKPE